MAPDNPTVKQYMAQFQEEDRRAFEQHATHIDCSNVTDIRIEILIAAKDGKDPTDGAFKLQPDEIPVTKEWIKIDSSQMRDLRNVPPDQRSRCVAATAAEVEQLVKLGVFALVRADKVPGANPMDSQIIWRIKYDSLGNYLKDKARLVMKGRPGVSGDYETTIGGL